MKNISSFSIAFLLVGLPILFIIRDYMPISKSLFTNSIVGILLFTIVDYNNLLRFKFFSKTPFYIIFLFYMLFFIFIINSLFALNYTKEDIYLFVIIFTFTALLTRKNNDFDNLYLYVLILSSASSIFTALFVPLDTNYWYSHGGRLYVGDTGNPNLTAYISMLNILTIIYYFIHFRRKKNLLRDFFLMFMMILSLFLYSLSFSKSVIIGFIFALIYIIPPKILLRKKIFSKSIVIIFVIILVLLINSTIRDIVMKKIDILVHAYYAYFYGYTENIARDSAAIRHMNLTKALEKLSEINLFNGCGIHMTRADMPILQVFTDLGFIAGLINLYLMIIYPMVLFFKNKSCNSRYQKFILMIFIYSLPNLFLHGTPYEFSIWLPILLMYKFAFCNTNDSTTLNNSQGVKYV